MSIDILNICCVISFYVVLIFYLRPRHTDQFHLATAIIILSSIFSSNQNHDGIKDAKSWELFDITEQASLGMAWCSLFVLKISKNHHYAILAQRLIFFAFISKSGVRALLDFDVIGLPIIVTALFIPPFYEQESFLICDENISFMRFDMSSKWFFRIYYITVGLWHLFGRYDNRNSSSIYMVLTVAIPFAVGEIYYDQNQVHIFLIHFYIVIWSSIIHILNFTNIYSTFDFYEVPILRERSATGILLRNTFQFGTLIIIFFFARRRKVYDVMISAKNMNWQINGPSNTPASILQMDGFSHYQTDARDWTVDSFVQNTPSISAN